MDVLGELDNITVASAFVTVLTFLTDMASGMGIVFLTMCRN